ncbi:MAG: hypothetical protein O7G86_06585, partial [Gammaproteobacteria bacterium]|nr:hypothetical protein [Gammaproteobacteria bacterium]
SSSVATSVIDSLAKENVSTSLASTFMDIPVPNANVHTHIHKERENAFITRRLRFTRRKNNIDKTLSFMIARSFATGRFETG